MTETAQPKRGGRPFHSILEPHFDFIREQRQQRKTWQEIATLLRTEKGCVITFQGLHQFYRRYLKRQAATSLGKRSGNGTASHGESICTSTKSQRRQQPTTDQSISVQH